MCDQNFELRFMRRRAITSYGILLFTTNSKNEIFYQLCQRRDSISYAEFLKDTLTPDIIKKHINMMSKEERQRLIDGYKNNNVDTLWDELWVNHQSRIYKNDLKRCRDTFNEKMEKYMDCFTDVGGGRKENPWGFSKGRKNINETEVECALREFEEETTISKTLIQVLKIRPFEELYTGTDGRLYRSVYYIAYIPYIPSVNIHNNCKLRGGYISEEVSDIIWCNYSDSICRLDAFKQNILKQLNRILLFKKQRKPPPRRFTY